MQNQPMLLINTLLLAMACALLAVAVRAAPVDSQAAMTPSSVMSQPAPRVIAERQR